MSKKLRFKKRLASYITAVQKIISYEDMLSMYGVRAINRISPEERLLYDIISKMSYRQVYSNIQLRLMLYNYLEFRGL